MRALDAIQIPDTVLRRTSLSMTEEIWDAADRYLKLYNEHRRDEKKRALSREAFIELCLRWAFAELDAEMVAAVQKAEAKDKRKAG